MNQVSGRWPVAVFAHNEEDCIEACVRSLLDNRQPGIALEVHVLANACSDGTETVVARLAASEPSVRLHSISIGDKANAWNVYVHEVAPESDVHFFIDGDVQACAGALLPLAQALAAAPQANAAAALPVSGRAMEQTRRRMVSNRDLAGNLYALSGDFVRRLRAQQIAMPRGFIGEDSLVGAFAKYDLDPARGWDDSRIVSCEASGFAFESLSALKPADWRLYWNRRIRYSMRKFQMQALRRQVERQGFHAMPVDVRELYRDPEAWAGGPADPLFDLLARRRIRKASAPK